MNNPYLFKYNEQKWDWTRSAAIKFMNGFNHFDGYMNDKEQVYIGVYGPTQVGKTTFILTLLGISLNSINEVANALRGGRKKGMSATVTCTIFKKTNEVDFQIIWPSGESFKCTSLEQVEQVMANLRNQIYEFEQFPLTPLIIEIPKDYFNQVDIDSRVRDLSIIDLPGDDSKDISEIHHVNRVLKEYISRCKVCIIMEIASQLTSLTKLDRDIVKDWSVLPEQFRIVLTRSVTNGSVMHGILDNTVSTVDEFKALYQNELSRVSNMNDVGVAVFPLEFGDSWMELNDTHPELFYKVNVWVQALFTELVKELTQIHSPEQEIKKIKSMERYIIRQHHQENEIYQEKRKRLIKEVKGKKTSIGSLVDRMKNEKTRLQQIDRELGSIQTFYINTMPSIDILSWENILFSDKKSSHLRHQFNANLEDLQVEAQQHVDEFNLYIKKLNRQNNFSLPSMTFPVEYFETELYIDYVIDRYFKESTYTIDVHVAKDKLENIFKQFIKHSNEELGQAIRTLQKERNVHHHICHDYYAQFQLRLKEKKQIQTELDDLAKEIKKINIGWQKDIARSKQLDLFLMESFVEQSTIYQKRLLDQETSISEKWVIHQFWNLLKMQAERIIDNVY